GGPGRGRRPGPLYLRRQPPKTPLLPYTTLFRSGRTPTRGRFVGGEIAAFGLAPADFRQRFAAQQRGALRKAICQQLAVVIGPARSEEHTSELQSREKLVCPLRLATTRASASSNG